MKKGSASLLIFFFAAVISMRAQSAPSTSACAKQKQRSVGEMEEDRVLSECEYHSLDKRTLIDDILTACRRIVHVSSDIHHKLLGPNSLVSDCTVSYIRHNIATVTLAIIRCVRSGRPLECTATRALIPSLQAVTCSSMPFTTLWPRVWPFSSPFCAPSGSR